MSSLSTHLYAVTCGAENWKVRVEQWAKVADKIVINAFDDKPAHHAFLDLVSREHGLKRLQSRDRIILKRLKSRSRDKIPSVRQTTLKEFEKIRQAILHEPFEGDATDPIRFGLERSLFAKQQLGRLIAAAELVNSLTVRSKLKQWKRQLERMERASQRFDQLRQAAKEASAVEGRNGVAIAVHGGPFNGERKATTRSSGTKQGASPTSPL